MLKFKEENDNKNNNEDEFDMPKIPKENDILEDLDEDNIEERDNFVIEGQKINLPNISIPKPNFRRMNAPREEIQFRNLEGYLEKRNGNILGFYAVV